jgi:hypothetical protein
MLRSRSRGHIQRCEILLVTRSARNGLAANRASFAQEESGQIDDGGPVICRAIHQTSMPYNQAAL